MPFPISSFSIPPLFYGFVFAVFAFGIAFFYVSSRHRRFYAVSSALNLELFKILIAEDDHKADAGAQEKPEEIFLKMEQLYSGLYGLKRNGWKAFLRGRPSFTFEMALPETGKNMVLYAAIPALYVSTFEKLVHSIFPTSRIEPSEDYNIFNAEGVTKVMHLKLARTALLPVKTYEDLGQEPFSVIAGAFAKLREQGEGAAIQIVFRPSSHAQNALGKSVAKRVREGKSLKEALAGGSEASWSHAFKTVLGLGASQKEKERAGAPRAIDEETAKLLEVKAARVDFDVNIRLVASSSSEDDADRILRELEAVFLQFAEPQGNSFQSVLLGGRAFERAIYKFSFRMFEPKISMYLNAMELASVFHFPRNISASPHVEFLKSKEAPPPSEIPKAGLLLGKSAFRGEEIPIYIARDDRRRHVYIIGQTGTGKTALMRNMIQQDIEAGEGICFIDPHGENAEEILGLIPKERVEDVIYFNPADIERPMGLNFLEYDPRFPEQKTFLVNELFSIFQKLYSAIPESMGPMFEQYFRNSTLLVMEDPASGNTLLEVERVLTDQAFRNMKLSRTANVIVRTFWKQIAEKAGGESSLQNMVPYITSKFDTFLANDIMRPIIAQEHSSFDFRKVMDEKKILLINLSKGRLGEQNSGLLGLIVVGKLLAAAFSRVEIAEEMRSDFYLYIDEFQNVTTPSIATILSEARKYRLDLTIAHQFIGQLEENIRKAVFGNAGSMIAFRIGADDAEFMEKQFAPIFNGHDLLNINNYNAYVDLLINGQTSSPFNIQTIPPSRGNPAVREAVKDLSRLKYGSNRQEVEAEIIRRHEKFT